MLIQNQEMETRLQRLENEKNQIIEDDNKQLDEGESSELFVKTITRMKMQKRYVKVKILIKPNFLKEFLALVDSGSNINCVPEGLIQTLFFEKTYQGVVSANSQPLAIYFKFSNVHICNQNICFKTSLLLVKEMHKEIILGTPFVALLYPFKVDSEWIKIVYKRQNICFKMKK